jgi:adhesin transport system outer membrane protein
MQNILVGLFFFAISGHVVAAGLEQAIQTTLAKHPAVLGKQAEVEARAFDVDVAASQRLPSLSTQLSANDNSTEPVTLRLRQPLWTFGRIDADVSVAETQKLAEQAEFADLKQSLIDQTTAAYVKVIGAQAKLAASQTNTDVLTDLHASIERREKGQLASRADVALVQARLVQANAQTARFIGDLELAQEELLALTQIPVVVSDDVDSRWTELTDLEAITDEVNLISPSVLTKQRLIEVAQAQVDVERSANMPTVYAQAEHYINQPNNLDDTVLGLGIESNLSGGFGMASRRSTKAAQARVDAAIQDLVSTRVSLTRQVSSLWSRRTQQYALLTNAQESVKVLEQLLASYLRQYQAGTKSWLDVVNMQRELHEQRLQRVQAQYDWLRDSLKLSVLSGRFDSLESSK